MKIIVSFSVMEGYQTMITRHRSLDIGGGYTTIEDDIRKLGGEKKVEEAISEAMGTCGGFVKHVLSDTIPRQIIDEIRFVRAREKLEEEATKKVKEKDQELSNVRDELTQAKKDLAMFECEMRGMIRQQTGDESTIPNKSGQSPSSDHLIRLAEKPTPEGGDDDVDG